MGFVITAYDNIEICVHRIQFNYIFGINRTRITRRKYIGEPEEDIKNIKINYTINQVL